MKTDLTELNKKYTGYFDIKKYKKNNKIIIIRISKAI